MPVAKLSDPYSWAGKVGVDSGPVPLSRWRGNVVNTKQGTPEGRTSDNHIANEQMRPETRGRNKKEPK